MLLSSAPPSLQTLLLMAMTPLVVSLLVLLGIHICFAEFDIQCPQGSTMDDFLDKENVLLLEQPDCGYSVAMAPNENDERFLDIYLEGTLPGWVAVGFSLDKKMAYSDVVGCKQDSAGNVGIIDSWNGETPPNKIDPTQEGMCNHLSSYVDGKFSCYFSRYYAILNVDFDYNLNNSFYFLLGCSDTKSDLNVNFPYHNPSLPAISEMMYNPFTYVGNGTSIGGKSAFEKRMIRAHGILMVIAYPVLLLTAVFFAAWMKPAMPKMWFQFHRALTLSSLVVALLAFAIIFIANKDNPTPGIINLHGCGTKTTHFAFGIIAVFLHVVNPIIAVIRCKPDHPSRWIFNLFHGAGVGLLTEIIALINIALGATIFQSDCEKPDKNNVMLWLYISWLFLVLGTQAFLYAYFTFKAIRGEIQSAPLLVNIILKKVTFGNYLSLNEDRDIKNHTPQSKAEDTVRYGALCLQLCSTIVMAIILTVFIAIDNFN